MLNEYTDGCRDSPEVPGAFARALVPDSLVVKKTGDLEELRFQRGKGSRSGGFEL